jgi:predicted nucleotidyltransferase
MASQPGFPTALHQQAADEIVAFFSTQPQTDAVLLVNSCACGTATPESDLDIAVLVSPTQAPTEREALEQQWRHHALSQPIFHDTLS